MNLSWKIGTAFGIPIRLHFSMIIVPFLAMNWVGGFGSMGFLLAGIGVVLVFGSILAHELGHALTARRFGVHTQDIVLTPIGGMARIVNMPTRPAQEIIIAVAGPAVSLVLAGASFIATAILSFSTAPRLVLDGIGVVFWINLMLGLFNLIPALPMDGGRILRGVLATKHDFLTATRKAARVGRVLAVVGFSLGGLVLLGRFSGFSVGLSPWSIILISAFVYYSAGQEERVAAWREAQAQGGFGAPKPSTGGYRYWTWTTGPGATATGPGARGEEGWGASPTDPRAGWASGTRPSQTRPGGAGVVVIQGGKAKIISRKDPEG